jgi:hypothetical protein
VLSNGWINTFPQQRSHPRSVSTVRVSMESSSAERSIGNHRLNLKSPFVFFIQITLNEVYVIIITNMVTVSTLNKFIIMK